MTFLRSDSQLALNELESLCLEAVDRYAANAGKTDDAALAESFAQRGQEHGRLAAELAQHIRALDDLPQTPDPDREAVESLFTSLKALLSADGRAALVDDCHAIESRIAAAAEMATTRSLPADTIALLHRILSQARHALAALDAVR